MAKDVIRLNNEGKTITLPTQDGEWLVSATETYSAMEMLLASIGACSVSVFTDVLIRSRIDATLEGAEVTYTRYSEEENVAKPVKSATVTLLVKAEDEHAEGRATRAVPLVQKYCTVIQSVNKQIEVEEKIRFI